MFHVAYGQTSFQGNSVKPPRIVEHRHRHESPGVIRADEAYTIAEFRRRAGLGDYAFRQARGGGLRIIEVGKKRYVLGRDWLAYLERIAGEN